jgi:hypothetical protein
MRLAPSRCTGGFSEALRLGTTAFLALVAACSAINPARAVTIDWVTVGDQGNASQSFWFGPSGAVAYDYRIMKYEWTNSSYLQFLNAIDPQGINPNNVFKQGSSYYQGIVRDSLNPDGSKYVLRKQAFADKPVNYVNWFDAARVANWLHNGSPTYVTSDASANAPHNGGAYSLGTATSGRPATKNPGALFYIPTNDEWHKAAYYKGGGTDAGYWNYPTQSNTEPTPITPTLESARQARLETSRTSSTAACSTDSLEMSHQWARMVDRARTAHLIKLGMSKSGLTRGRTNIILIGLLASRFMSEQT